MSHAVTAFVIIQLLLGMSDGVRSGMGSDGPVRQRNMEQSTQYSCIPFHIHSLISDTYARTHAHTHKHTHTPTQRGVLDICAQQWCVKCTSTYAIEAVGI